MDSTITSRGWAVLLASVVACLVLGALSGMTASASSGYSGLEMPPLSPPGLVFPVAWTVLSILLGISLWLVYRSGGDRAFYILFAVQMALNLAWVPLFFGYGLMADAMFDLVFMWLITLMMILVARRNARTASYLLVPYILWLTFAAYLNAGALLLNRCRSRGCSSHHPMRQYTSTTNGGPCGSLTSSSGSTPSTGPS